MLFWPLIFAQPSQYINTLLVPKDGEIPIDIQSLSSQGIFDVVIVNSIHDLKVGTIFDPVSLINALGNVFGVELSKGLNCDFELSYALAFSNVLAKEKEITRNKRSRSKEVLFLGNLRKYLKQHTCGVPTMYGSAFA
ncbi:uncharacterized protein LOC128283931 [Gossypium arboreum]|uniref:uncharacterized protein LOC128283931 n=1 Tax=Gossypium arboreum TaxID=29729 RepID=UPI0022F18BAA|nr:uncharacterized protein LOC128283931 [Gossypium arboreum]